MIHCDSCDRCNKFSHCNNNDLICVSRYRELERKYYILKGEIKSCCKAVSYLAPQSTRLLVRRILDIIGEQ